MEGHPSYHAFPAFSWGAILRKDDTTLMLKVDSTLTLKERSQRNRKLRLRQGKLAAADDNSAARVARCPDRSHPARTARVRAGADAPRRRFCRKSAQYKRDCNRESRGRYQANLDAGLAPIVETLADDRPLKPRHHDHALSGEWSDHRDCHVKPDLVLIYQKSSTDTLRLVRLGSHSELGL